MPTSVHRKGTAERKIPTKTPAATVTASARIHRYTATQINRTAKHQAKATLRCVVHTTPVATTAMTGYVHRKRRSCSMANPTGIRKVPTTIEPAR